MEICGLTGRERQCSLAKRVVRHPRKVRSASRILKKKHGTETMLHDARVGQRLIQSREKEGRGSSLEGRRGEGEIRLADATTEEQNIRRVRVGAVAILLYRGGGNGRGETRGTDQ